MKRLFEKLKLMFARQPRLRQTCVSGSLLSFEQCLREEFLLNTQNYPKDYHKLFQEKFERAQRRFREQSGNDR